MSDKPSNSEEEYFAREQAEKLRKRAIERKKELAAEEADALKAAHWMRCAKCGHEMDTMNYKGVDIERCFHCGYMGLDEGELEKIVKAEEQAPGVTAAILNIFKGK